MNIKKHLLNFKTKFLEFWNHKIFRIAVLVHIFYIIFSIILFFTVFYTQNDFRVYYETGRRFLFDINNLYSQENYYIHFRYFPMSALFYIPFSLFEFNMGYILFTLINILLNLGITIVLYKLIILVIGERTVKEDKVVRYLSVYLVAIPHIDNFILGQINLYVVFLILLSIYLFMNKGGLKWDFIASIIMGMGICIKPITFLIIPFLIVINYHLRERRWTFKLKDSLIRLTGVALVLLPNILFFFLFPKLWQGFLRNNFGGNRTIEINFSFSLTKLIINMFMFFSIPFNQTAILLFIFLIFGGIAIFVFLFTNNKETSIIYGVALSTLIMLLVYYDSWTHHLLMVIPLLILITFDLTEYPELIKRYIKPSLIFFSFLDLLFMGIWHITEQWFPFNFESTIFLILSFYAICKFLIISKYGNGDKK